MKAWLPLVLVLSVSGFAVVVAACSDDPAAASKKSSGDDDDDDDDDDDTGDDDVAGDDDTPKGDGGAGDSAPIVLPTVNEAEPNDDAPDAGLPQAVTVPAQIHGAIGTADDRDLFKITFGGGSALGTVWQWQVRADGSTVAPHFLLIDSSGTLPTIGAGAVSGGTLTFQHFVMGSGPYVAVVRDDRNVKAPSKHVGSADLKYELSAQPIDKAPAPVGALPFSKSASLAGFGMIDLYSFDAAADAFAVNVEIKAERKAAKSQLDSRLSLYSIGEQKWIATNDDIPSPVTTDSKLSVEGLKKGKYVVVVEHEGDAPTVTDLSYDLTIAAK